MKRYVAAGTQTRSVFSSWTEAYELFDKVIEHNLSSLKSGYVDDQVAKLYSIFRGDPNMEEGYRRWDATSQED